MAYPTRQDPIMPWFTAPALQNPSTPQPKLPIRIMAGGHEYKALKETITATNATFKKIFGGPTPSEGYYFLEVDGYIFGHVLRFIWHGVFPRLTIKDDKRLDYQVLEHQAKFFGLKVLSDGANDVLTWFDDYQADKDGKMRTLQHNVYDGKAP